MVIDSNDIPIGIAQSDYEIRKLKSGVIVNGIKKINNTDPIKNFMIMSMNVFNILELHDRFEHKNLLGRPKEDGIYEVGRIANLDCYVDLTMDLNQIILHWDKSIMRDIKINQILNSSIEEYDGELKIDVII